MILLEAYLRIIANIIELVITYLIFNATISFLLPYTYRVPEISSDNAESQQNGKTNLMLYISLL